MPADLADKLLASDDSDDETMEPADDIICVSDSDGDECQPTLLILGLIYL